MYVIESIIDKDTRDIFYRCLHDVDLTQLNEWKERFKDDPTRRFHKVTATNAHNWVRQGGLHTTYLYLDGNRIRKAS